MEKKIEDIRGAYSIQKNDPSIRTDPYMRGMFNGMEVLVAILEDREPEFVKLAEKEAPTTMSTGDFVHDLNYITRQLDPVYNFAHAYGHVFNCLCEDVHQNKPFSEGLARELVEKIPGIQKALQDLPLNKCATILQTALETANAQLDR
ncbi:MAG: hypothetical protein ACRDBZ_05225 [Citrobacter braakii]